MDIISTEGAPKALGPYSQAIKAGGFIWCSGQIPIDPAANAVTATTVEGQTRQAITNLKNVLEAAGAGLDKVVKTLPALHAPTVNKLNDESWFAVESVVEERKVRDLIPALTKAGATGIIELPLNKIIF